MEAMADEELLSHVAACRAGFETYIYTPVASRLQRGKAGQEWFRKSVGAGLTTLQQFNALSLRVPVF